MGGGLADTVTIMHLADVHLGAGQSVAAEDADAERLRSAVERAFARAIDDALTEAVQLVVIPGDLFDGAWADYRVALRAAEQMARLHEACIPCAIVRGNHDAESQISGRTPWPDNVKVFDHRKPETWELENIGVAVHGQSFARRDVTENLAIGYPEPVPGLINIGLLHTALDGREGHSNYAPCRVDELVARGYDYWALGHVHSFECVHEAPWIVYPGNLQGRHARELGPKGYVLARFCGGDCTIEHRCSDVLRWAECVVEIGRLPDLDAVFDAAIDAVAAEMEQADGRDLAVRLRLRGSGPAAAEAHRDLDALREGLEIALAPLRTQSGVWLEKIKLERSSVEEPAVRMEEAAQVLEDFMQDSAPELLPELLQELEPMLRKLPARLARQAFDLDSEAWQADFYQELETLLSEAARPARGEGAA